MAGPDDSNQIYIKHLPMKIVTKFVILSPNLPDFYILANNKILFFFNVTRINIE